MMAAGVTSPGSAALILPAAAPGWSGFAPPDPCSIRTANEQEELAEAVRGGFSADGYPPGDDDPPVTVTSGIDRAIRLGAHSP